MKFSSLCGILNYNLHRSLYSIDVHAFNCSLNHHRVLAEFERGATECTYGIRVVIDQSLTLSAPGLSSLLRILNWGSVGLNWNTLMGCPSCQFDHPTYSSSSFQRSCEIGTTCLALYSTSDIGPAMRKIHTTTFLGRTLASDPLAGFLMYALSKRARLVCMLPK